MFWQKIPLLYRGLSNLKKKKSPLSNTRVKGTLKSFLGDFIPLTIFFIYHSIFIIFEYVAFLHTANKRKHLILEVTWKKKSPNLDFRAMERKELSQKCRLTGVEPYTADVRMSLGDCSTLNIFIISRLVFFIFEYVAFLYTPDSFIERNLKKVKKKKFRFFFEKTYFSLVWWFSSLMNIFFICRSIFIIFEYVAFVYATNLLIEQNLMKLEKEKISIFRAENILFLESTDILHLWIFSLFVVRFS